ncbi:mechanosensitive ion channel [Alcaligenaceae bacterium]|nr:mechanosensitive ion channel [Alcaligenaceae bacterium]
MLTLFFEHLLNAWKPFYWPLIALNLLFGFLLWRVARRMLLHTLQGLVLFVVLLLVSVVAAMLDSGGLAHGLQETATIVLGILLIRLMALALFRLIMVRMGLHPPRIVEELLILIAYLGWLMARLSLAGLDFSGLLASTAVITAVLAFAMQDTLGNILSGLALQLDHSIHIGDWVQIDTVSGRVMQVQWRYTAVRTLFGEMVLIPNSTIMKSQVMLTGGLSAPRRLRTVNFYAGFELEPNKVVDIVVNELTQAEMPNIASDPAPICAVLDFADGMVCYVVRYWLTNPETPGSSDSLIRQHLYTLFKRQGWRMGAPSHNMRVSSTRSEPRQDLFEQETRQRLAVLKAVSLLSPLTPDEMHKLARGLRFLPYLKGSTIARQGDIGDCLFIITQGEVDVLVEANRQSRRLATLGAGQVMGEMSVMTGEPRRATLKASTDVHCHALGKADFEEILQLRPELAEAFAQLLTQRSQELQEVKSNMPTAHAAVQRADILDRMRRVFGLADGI